jgi:hypothetical protein
VSLDVIYVILSVTLSEKAVIEARFDIVAIRRIQTSEFGPARDRHQATWQYLQFPR